MSTYYVDFSGWCKVEANSGSTSTTMCPLPHNVYKLEEVEEDEETTD